MQSRVLEASTQLLCDAVRHGRLDIVRDCLQQLSAAQVNAFDDKGRNALVLATKSRHANAAQIFSFLTQHAKVDVNQPTRNGTRALFAACRQGRVDKVQALLQAGADASLQNPHGETMLMAAAVSGNTNLIDPLFRAAGVSNLNHQGDTGKTALYAAVEFGQTKFALVLMVAGANISIAANHGFTPLFQATFDNRVRMVELLLHYGADLLEGRTAQILPAFFALRSSNARLLSLFNRYLYNPAARLIKIGFSGSIPSRLRCGVSNQLMRDPITVSSGQRYDRYELFKYVGFYFSKPRRDRSRFPCPVTRHILTKADLFVPTDEAVKKEIETFVHVNEYAAGARHSLVVNDNPADGLPPDPYFDLLISRGLIEGDGPSSQGLFSVTAADAQPILRSSLEIDRDDTSSLSSSTQVEDLVCRIAGI